MFLDSFKIPDIDIEENVLNFDSRLKSTIYKSVYPFKIFQEKQLEKIDFSDITVFYGGNGSGKTTLLNIIAEKLKLKRGAYYNKTDFFDTYVDLCDYNLEYGNVEVPTESRIITSDDVFDYMLDNRCLQNGINNKREELVNEFFSKKKSNFKLKSLDDYEELKKHNDAKRGTCSNYVKDKVVDEVPQNSNGETALHFFTNKVKENAIYILDEPENSLSVEKQIELKKYLEDSARFFGCQLIIATHSPFLLSMDRAMVYDLDSKPAKQKDWYKLDNVKVQFEFFYKNKDKFLKENE